MPLAPATPSPLADVLLSYISGILNLMVALLLLADHNVTCMKVGLLVER